MELDKRIKEGKRPLTCFDVEIAKQFIGKEGYFSHYIDNYADLKNTVLGTLGSTGDIYHESFVCTEETFDNYYYEFFIPAEWVKEPEKKYRPFSLIEFVDQYSLGDEVIVRRKSERNKIRHRLFVEYTENETKVVHLGSYWFTFEELFNEYELYTGEKWKPFGIKE